MKHEEQWACFGVFGNQTMDSLLASGLANNFACAKLVGLRNSQNTVVWHILCMHILLSRLGHTFRYDTSRIL